MAQINKPTDYFNGLPYTGNDTATSYNNGLDMNTNGGLVWLKTRNAVGDHGLFDSVRGVNKRIRSNTTDTEDTLASNGVTSFDSTGFSLGTVAYNDTPYTFMSWSWLAGGTASSNTDGDVTSQVSANTTSGFSIVSWTTSGSSGNNSIGHGLGVAPKMIIMKATDVTYNWDVFHNSIMPTGAGRMILNQTSDYGTSFNPFGSVAPTNTVFYNDTGFYGNAHTIIAYCFAEKKGFSKFGSYTGNGNADGTFVYTGFSPAFVIIKRTDGASDWVIQDNKRDGFNYNNHRLFANTNATEESTVRMDLLSNGFKCRDNDGNGNGFSYIYMAFAENPLVGTNNIPAVAR